ncbi:MAG: PEGA domain-containing protein [Deltaproteobacteria bacterium]|nr:PEGA domain-containing protein [Deltaproteobacteria bacterium]
MALGRQSGALFAQAREAYVHAFPYVASFGEISQCLLDHAAYEIESGSAKVGAELLAEYLTIGGPSPDPAAYSPRVLNALEGQRQRRGETLAFSVSTVPAGAEIWVDGARIDAQTPLTIPSLRAGWHWLLVKKDYYKPFASRVFVTPNNAAIAAKLEPHSPEAECLLHIEEEQRACPGYAAVLATRVARLAVRTLEQGRVSVRFFASVREIRVTVPSDAALPATAPSSTSKPVVLALPTPAAPAPVHPALAILPLGIGQFAEKRYGVATFFLASQVLLLALQTTTFAMAYQGRAPDGRYVDQASARRAQTLQIINLVAVGALGADVIAGGIDGLVHRRPK